MGLNITVKNILPIVLKARTLKTECEKYYSSIKIFLPGERLCTREGLNKSTAGVPILFYDRRPNRFAIGPSSFAHFHIFKFSHLLFFLISSRFQGGYRHSYHAADRTFASVSYNPHGACIFRHQYRLGVFGIEPVGK